MTESARRPLGIDTLAIRESLPRTQYNEHNEPVFLTSSFVFDNAAQAAARFAGDEDGFIYSRAGNPTVAAFQARLAALEGGEACVATASGMSAIMATVMSLTRAGDHVVAAFELFGATLQMFGILQRFGIDVSFVPIDDVDAWRRAIRPNTKLLYLESPSNPLTKLADLRAIATIAEIAIFHSKRKEMKIDTRTKNTMSARTAFSVMLRPHEELTAATLTSWASTPASAASSLCTALRTSAGWSPTCTRMRRPSAPFNT